MNETENFHSAGLSSLIQSFLPYGRHCVDEDDIDAVVAVLRSDWLTTGPTIEALETALADKVGAKFALTCSSGTAGLHLAALALNLNPGEVVVVPSLTFVATANAVRLAGAEVIFADVEAGTGLMSPATLLPALERAGDSARAIFPVHLNGQTVDMPAVGSIGQERGLMVVEDAAHALGASTITTTGEELSVGSCRHSDLTMFSLHPVKAVAMGEGGIVTTNDVALHERLVRFRNHGITRDPHAFVGAEQACDQNGQLNPWYYEVTQIGLNYRASDIHCALALSQLKKLDAYLAKTTDTDAAIRANLRGILPEDSDDRSGRQLSCRLASVCCINRLRCLRYN